jgi:Flp pilus assembly protein TadG
MSQNQRGMALIEFSFTMTLLLLLVMGVIDFALVIQKAMVVNEAAYVAAQWGASPYNSWNLTEMQTIAQNSATGVAGFSAVATKWCTCSPAGSAVACTSTCTGNGTPIAYVQVATSATAPVLFRYSVLPISVPLGGLCVMRVQ